MSARLRVFNGYFDYCTGLPINRAGKLRCEGKVDLFQNILTTLTKILYFDLFIAQFY